MARALFEQGVVPDLIIGTSAGALNGGVLARDPSIETVDALEQIWLGVNRSTFFPIKPVTASLGLLSTLAPVVGLEKLYSAVFGSPSLFSSGGLRSFIAEHLEFDRLEAANTRLAVVATDIKAGQSVLLQEGPAEEAIYASAAIPAMLPSINIDGRELVDGGITNNSPLSYAIEMGADTIYTLPTGFHCRTPKGPTTILETCLQTLTILATHKLQDDAERYKDDADIFILPPVCNVAPLMTDFSATEQIILNGYALAADWLGQHTSPLPAPGSVLN